MTTMELLERPTAAGAHTMRLMDPKLGDLELKWDEDKPDEVAAARATFEKAKKRGLAMYKMSTFGRKTGEQLHEFGPLLARGEVPHARDADRRDLASDESVDVALAEFRPDIPEL